MKNNKTKKPYNPFDPKMNPALESALKTIFSRDKERDRQSMEHEGDRRRITKEHYIDMNEKLDKRSTPKRKLKYLNMLKEEYETDLTEVTIMNNPGQMTFYQNIIDKFIIPQERELKQLISKTKKPSKKVNLVKEKITNDKILVNKLKWRANEIIIPLTDLLMTNKIVDEIFRDNLLTFFKGEKVLTKIRLNVPRNVITTLFYFLHDTGNLQSTKKFSSKAIFNAFTDEAGKAFKSPNAIYQDLKDNLSDRRLKIDSKYYGPLYNLCYK